MKKLHNEKVQKLTLMKKASEVKEIERINSLSKEEIDAEIALEA